MAQTASDIISDDDVRAIVEKIRNKKYQNRRAFREYDATDINSNSIEFPLSDGNFDGEISEVPPGSEFPRATKNYDTVTAAHTKYGFEIVIPDEDVEDSVIPITMDQREDLVRAEETRVDNIAYGVLSGNTNSAGPIDASSDASGTFEYADIVAAREQAFMDELDLGELVLITGGQNMSDFLNMDQFTQASELGDQVVTPIVLDNADGKYTVDRPIDFDDELEFRVAWEGASTGVGFGEGPFGEVPFGTTQWNTSSTLLVTSVDPQGPRSTSILELSVENFVFNRLRERNVNEYRQLEAPISGSSDAHLDTILAEYVPDVDASQLPTISETIDYSVDKKAARKVVAELARLAHAATGKSWIVGSDAKALTFEAVDDLEPKWTADDGVTDFKGTFQHSMSAGDLVNEVRVEGGVDPDNVDD